MDYKITTIMSLLMALEDKLYIKGFHKDFMIGDKSSSIHWDGEELSISIENTLDFDVSFMRFNSDTAICLYDNEGGFSYSSFNNTLKEEYENILGHDDTQIILEHGRKMKMLIQLYAKGFMDCYDQIEKESKFD